MKQIITAKLKINTTADQFQALHTTQLAYGDALSAVSYYAFEHGKTSSNPTTRECQKLSGLTLTHMTGDVY